MDMVLPISLTTYEFSLKYIPHIIQHIMAPSQKEQTIIFNLLFAILNKKL